MTSANKEKPEFDKAGDALDLARRALLAFAKADIAGEGALFEVSRSFDQQPIDEAILRLDSAGAVEAVLHADWNGHRSWRVRRVSAAGREIARLIEDEKIWSRLRDDLSRAGDPFALLVARYADNITMAGAA